MSESCLFCGGVAERRHHPTGRGGDSQYLDADFVMDVCHDDHTLTHDDWYALGVESTPAGATILDLVELAMRRLGLMCARMTAHGSVWTGLALWFARNADLLARAIAALDRHYPGWRSAPV